MGDVTLTNLSKHFDSVIAVDDIDLTVQDGEFLVLVGPSGCGKSTTLRMIAGLEEATNGTISIAQENVTDRHPKDRDVAMVFQNYALYPHMNVYDNIAFGLTLRKMPDNEIDERVKEAAQLLGIGELLDRRPGELSGGQRQRVAVGRAIVREPEVFLMDEPLSNLDAKLRVEMRAELLKLHNKLKTTMIYVTHDQTEAMTMGDRIVVMLDGLIQQVGKPLEIYQNPTNVFVAGFIGSPSMNFLDVTLRKKDGGYYLDAGEIEFQVPEEMVSQYSELEEYNGKTIILGIRPEDIYDAGLGNGKGTGGSQFDAQVEVIEPMGSETHLYLRIGDQTLTASVEAMTTAEEGSALPVRFDLSKAHFFDKQTEERIK